MDKINYLVKKFQDGGVNFRYIKTTGNRGYNSVNVGYANEWLDSVPINRRSPILAVGIEESGMNPRAKGKNGEKGIFQFKEDRYVPHPKGDDNVSDHELLKWQLQQGLEAMATPPNNSGNWTHGGEGTGIKRASDAYNGFYDTNATLEDANNNLNLGFIRPSGKWDSANNRMKVTQQIYDRLENQNKSSKSNSEKSNKGFLEELLELFTNR